MAALSSERLAALLQPFLQQTAIAAEPSRQPSGTVWQSRTAPKLRLEPLLDQLSTYLDLLLHWNRRVNLTSIRSPEEIVQRHFGESLFTGLHLAMRLPAHAQILDYGSGAGFPGLPIQLLLPEVHVTLAESQARKAAFLREAVRTLGLSAEIWAKRVDAMPKERTFDAVTLRAVDRMQVSLQEAEVRVRPGGWLTILAGGVAELPFGAEAVGLPGSDRRRLILYQKQACP